MLCRNFLKPGSAIKIQALDGEYQGEYETHVYDITDQTLTIHAPSYLGAILPLREGTGIKVLFWDNFSSYAMETSISKRLLSPGAMFQMKLNEKNIYKIQRRKYVRVPFIMPFVFRTIEKVGLSDDKKGTIVDLSGGGFLFRTNELMVMGNVIISNLDLNGHIVRIFARLIRVEEIQGKMKYSISAEFQDLRDRDRDRIIHYVFEIQRNMQTIKRKE